MAAAKVGKYFSQVQKMKKKTIIKPNLCSKVSTYASGCFYIIKEKETFVVKELPFQR